MSERFRYSKRCFGYLLITCALVLLHAPQRTQSQADDNTVRQLVAWIVKHSDLQVAPSPEIHFLPPSLLTSLADSGEIGEVKALYAIEMQTIFLAEGWDSQSVKDQSILLHELVHHLQIVNGVPRACRSQLNSHAYELQLRWLKEKGIEDAEDYIETNDAMIFLLSACPDPYGELGWP